MEYSISIYRKSRWYNKLSMELSMEYHHQKITCQLFISSAISNTCKIINEIFHQQYKLLMKLLME